MEMQNKQEEQIDRHNFSNFTTIFLLNINYFQIRVGEPMKAIFFAIISEKVLFDFSKRLNFKH